MEAITHGGTFLLFVVLFLGAIVWAVFGFLTPEIRLHVALEELDLLGGSWEIRLHRTGARLRVVGAERPQDAKVFVEFFRAGRWVQVTDKFGPQWREAMSWAEGRLAAQVEAKRLAS